MKIGVPLAPNGNIDNHFGHCSHYAVFTVSEKNEITEKQLIQTEQGCGCKSNIAQTLAELGVNKMLAGGIGEGAINVLEKHGINVVRGCSGNAENVVKAYIEGKIMDSGLNCVQHEHHHHHHHGHEKDNCHHNN